MAFAAASAPFLPTRAVPGRAHSLARCRNWILDALSPLPQPEYAPKAALAHDDADFRRLAFTFAVIALSAGLLRAKGGVSRQEYLAFCAMFPLEDASSRVLRRLFTLAWEEDAPPSHYTRQVMYLYPRQQALYRKLLAQLCRVAAAETGYPAGPELKYIAHIARDFGLSRGALSALIAKEAAEPEPLSVLGLPRGATPEQIRARYREQMKRYHPDRAAGAHAAETRALAAEKAVALNRAYGALTRRAL